VKSSGRSGLVRASPREKQVLSSTSGSIYVQALLVKCLGHLAPQNRPIYTYSVGVIDSPLLYVQ
jgi:hypothetical protein